MPDYHPHAREYLNDHMYEHATVTAVLGVAYEQRTANLLALNQLLVLDRMPGLMLQNGVLGGSSTELLAKVSAQILDRLNLTAQRNGTGNG
jgi:hypothetical protein